VSVDVERFLRNMCHNLQNVTAGLLEERKNSMCCQMVGTTSSYCGDDLVTKLSPGLVSCILPLPSETKTCCARLTNLGPTYVGETCDDSSNAAATVVGPSVMAATAVLALLVVTAGV